VRLSLSFSAKPKKKRAQNFLYFIVSKICLIMAAGKGFISKKGL